MTAPTQAQIEAAIEAFSKSAGYPIDARVADGSMLRANLIAALTAAAEAGDKDKVVDAFNDGYKKGRDNAMDATIERCAQVIKRVADNNISESASLSWNDAVATVKVEAIAAIRAMKEKP